MLNLPSLLYQNKKIIKKKNRTDNGYNENSLDSRFANISAKNVLFSIAFLIPAKGEVVLNCTVAIVAFCNRMWTNSKTPDLDASGSRWF